MCNCTSGNLEIPDRRFASSGMTVEIKLRPNAPVNAARQKEGPHRAGLRKIGWSTDPKSDQAVLL
jgi:hypothetical protein